MYTCRHCGAAYLDPRPTPGTIHRAYVGYLTHSLPSATVRHRWLSRAYFKRALKNGYLAGRYGYAAQPSWRLGRYLLALLPKQRGEVARWYMHLEAPPPSHARLLDIGCGSGTFLLQMASLGWDTQGIEPDAEAAGLARHSGLRVTVGTLAELDVPKGFFHAITMRHAIEHLPDPVATLRRCRELLCADGKLVIVTPNLESAGSRYYGRNWRGLEPPRHLVVFSDASLRLALRSSGFLRVSSAPVTMQGGIYQASAQIARGGGPPASRYERFTIWRRAIGADVRTLRHPREAEELFIVARP